MKRTPLIAWLCAILIAPQVVAQPEDWVISMTDAPLGAFITKVADITGETIVVDPRVKQNNNVTVISSVALDRDGVYELFLSVLRVHGYGVARTGDVLTVAQAPVVKQAGGRIGDGPAVPGEEIITRVIPAQNVPSADLVKTLRPLIPQYAHLAAVENPNVVIISDHANNIRRLMGIVAEIDVADEEEVLVVALEHAWVGTILALLQEVAPNQLGRGATGPQRVQLIANESNNTLVIRGKTRPIAKVLELIEKLDQPGTAVGSTQVIYLNHADAVTVAELLNNLDGISAPQGEEGSQVSNIQAYESLNAIIARGDPNSLNELVGVIDRLDVRRAQVHIAAAIVEVSLDASQALGVEMGAADARGSSLPFVSTTLNGIIGSLLNQTTADGSATFSPIQGVANATSPTLAAAKIDPDGVSFGAIVNALASESNANLLSTPSLLTLDNQQARILVGQQIPIRTGSFTTTTDGASNPFTTISRQDVGVELIVTPHIHDDSSVRLEVVQKVSSVLDAANQAGFSDVVTSNREIETTILADDRQTIVLGGLMQDDVRDSDRKLPWLGDIPIAGRLFKSSSNIRTKRHLLVFLRPTIQRTPADLKAIADKHYEGIRKIQIESHGDDADAAFEEFYEAP